MPRGGAEVVTIMWRDIPAQVNGQRGRERHQVALSAKFQRAIDRAKRKAGIVTADEDYLIESIMMPGVKQVKGYSLPMPSNSLTREQVDLIVTYISELASAEDGS